MAHQLITAVVALFAALCLLNSCDNPSKVPGTDPEAHSQHSMAMMQTMDAMMQRTNAMKMTGDFDVDFANMMVEHHQGAIDISEMELNEMKQMAQQMIDDHQREIAEFQAWLNKNRK